MGIFRVLLLAPNKRIKHSGIGFNPFVNASHTDAERHYFGKDHLGSIRAVTNLWGSPLRTYDYDVFGTPLQDRPERFRHGFTGKEYDSWTGLYNYGFRDYSAMFGRFTSVDPIQDGHNWYAYVNSDPVSWLDPWGLECPDQESGADSARGTGDRFDWEKYAEKINQEKQVYFNAHVNEWDGSRMGETAVIPPFTRVSNAAENHLGERYKDGNTCDEWTAKVLTEASFSPSDYYLGDTSQTVKQHIDELKSNGGDYSATSNSSAYVVFMGDGTRDYSVGHEHAGLLVIDSTGNVNFYHSSQGNEGKLSAMESYSSVSAFEKDFAYSSFYYQEVR